MLTLAGNATYTRRAARSDLEALKHAQPIQEVVARYGIELRRQGRSAVGRCPFQPDGGRPNLHIWADTRSWWCFRCIVLLCRTTELATPLGTSSCRISAGGVCRSAQQYGSGCSLMPAGNSWP